jgi:CheY-like chemotaxis protein
MKKIYLVDDDDDDRIFARDALEGVIRDVEITEFTDGKQLLSFLEHSLPIEPVVVLMDMNMPQINGLEALARLKDNPDFKHIPVVLFSTSAYPETVKKAYELGVNAYIVKPVTNEDYIRIAYAVSLCFLNHDSNIDLSVHPETFGKKTVVIIEDNQDQYDLMELSLKQSAPKLKVIHKSTARSSVDFFDSLDKKASAAIDLIILDLYLPTRKHGLDLLTRIRSMAPERGLSTVPIIVLSASGDPQDIKASYQLQANAYLVKTMQPAMSFSYLKDLCYFWQNTITTPSRVK